MAWWKGISLTVTTGQKIVAVVAGDDIAKVYPGDALLIGTLNPVEIKKAYVDGSSNVFIELTDPWPYDTQTGQPGKVLSVSNSLSEAITVLRDVGDTTTEFYGNVLDFLISPNPTVTFTANNQSYTVRSYSNLVAAVEDLTP